MPSNAHHPDESRHARQAAIRALLRDEVVTGQAVLVARLRERGFGVTQSSVSRDLRDLGAFKAGGRYRTAPTDGVEPSGVPADRPVAGVAHFLRGVRVAGPHLVVVLTAAGAAQTVAIALDRERWPQVVGTLAGDDTIFIAVPGPRARTFVERRFERLLAGPSAPAAGAPAPADSAA